MSRLFVLAHRLPARSQRTRLFLSLASAALLAVTAACAHAQFAAPEGGTIIHDRSALKPPAGARVAIVEFVDMECPVCGATNPTVRKAEAEYKIPLVRHDFLIPSHAWSRDAAIDARWFDIKSKALGDEYRDQVFANQASITTPNALRQFTEKFAQNHKIEMPFAIDPQGKLAADVKTDNELGIRTGIEHTPSVFVVTADSAGPHYVEVLHPQEQLYQTIDKALADTGAPAKTAVVKKPTAK